MNPLEVLQQATIKQIEAFELQVALRSILEQNILFDGIDNDDKAFFLQAYFINLINYAFMISVFILDKEDNNYRKHTWLPLEPILAAIQRHGKISYSDILKNNL